MATFTGINKGNTGVIQIHRPGCADLKRNARGSEPWTIEATSLKDIVLDIYDPECFLYDADTQWTDYLGDIDMIACTKGMLQEDTEAAPAPVQEDKPKASKKASKRRPQIDHTKCDHAQTPIARRKCRKAFWAAQATEQAAPLPVVTVFEQGDCVQGTCYRPTGHKGKHGAASKGEQKLAAVRATELAGKAIVTRFGFSN